MKKIKNLEKKEESLIEAFEKLIESDHLHTVKRNIEDQLKKFIVELKKKLKPNQLIFENLESRIKSVNSFREKLQRKGYLKTWEVTDSEKENRDYIAKNLPDLIGFRITCFFWENEDTVYDLLKIYSDAGKFNNINLNFNENCEQKNGHKIYKLTGLYDEQFSFELQIKSIMHNIWGEVEHKTIYKNSLDPNIGAKKSITEELFNILQAADKQLLTLLQENYTEEKLLQSLFYKKTFEKVAILLKTDILAEHYQRFFKLFESDEDKTAIKEYIATVLMGKKYRRKPTNFTASATDTQDLIFAIEENFSEYNLKALFYISSIIYKIERYPKFLTYLANWLIINYPQSDEDTFDEYAFDDSTEIESQTSKIENYIKILKEKIGGNK